MRLSFLLVALLLAGCAGRDPAPPPAGDTPWLAGDTWTYRLTVDCGEARDTWTVVGPGEREGRKVLLVRSVTTGCVAGDEIGFFDARTLALVRVETTGNVTLDFDPAETWLLPAGDRAYEARRTATTPQGTTEERVNHTVRHLAVGTVETDAGAFASERFEVVRSAEGFSETRTYWWAPAVLNVVREDVGDRSVRTLVDYRLVEGSRTVPGAGE